jgi:predicted Na+-dependent transporter
MGLNIPYLLALAVILFLFQLYASIRMLFYGGYSVGQKVVQLLIVWLVPLFGGLLVNAFISAHGKNNIVAIHGSRPTRVITLRG